MATNYREIVKSIAKQKPMGRQVARLPIGNYRVTVLSYTARESQQGKGAIFEAEFLDGDGNRRMQSWSPQASGWRGEFERSRANEFLTAVKDSVGYTGDLEDLAEVLLGPDQEGKGLQLDVEVSQKFEKDGQPVKTERGEAITDVIWKAFEQSGETVKASRAKIEGKNQPEKTEKPASLLGI